MTLSEALEAIRQGKTSISVSISGIDSINFNNSLGVSGAAAIAKALKTNQTVTRVYLRFTNLGDGGAAAIAEALKINHTITVISLSNNDIGDEGVAAIAEALKTNHTLSTIYLGGNQFGDTGATALAQALQANTTLTTIDLDSSLITHALRKQIAALVKRNQLLRCLKAVTSRQAVCMMIQNGSADVISNEFDAREHTDHFDIPFIHQALIRANELLSDVESPDDFRNEWLRHVVNFHLQCVDLECDISTPDDPHPFVLSALDALMQMDRENEHYAPACDALGKYFYHRVANHPKPDQLNKFQQLAVCFLSKAGDESQSIAARLRTALLATSSNSASTSSQTLNNAAPEQTAAVTTAGGAKTLLDVIATANKKPFDETKTLDEINDTRDAALQSSHKYQLFAVLSKLNQQKTLGATISAFFAPPPKEACNVLKRFIEEDGAPIPNLAHIQALENQPSLRGFFQAGRADSLAKTPVKSVRDFVTAMTKQSLPKQPLNQPIQQGAEPAVTSSTNSNR